MENNPPPVSQAVSFAKSWLRGLHDDEIMALATRLDEMMRAEAEKFIAEIRK